MNLDRTREKQETPTELFCREMTEAFDFFNRELFGGELPPVLITLQRRRSAYGYYSESRFADEGKAGFADEIAMNPDHFARDPEKTFSTLVHEMCHLWQAKFGKPGKWNYHNKQFANKMEEVGLVCSQTGKPGGPRTGKGMTHYIEPGGRFQAAFRRSDLAITWRDRFGPSGAHPRSKVKYTCPRCGCSAWGSNSLHIACVPCGTVMQPQKLEKQP